MLFLNDKCHIIIATKTWIGKDFNPKYFPFGKELTTEFRQIIDVDPMEFYFYKIEYYIQYL